ncbi:amino acid adenylation domain-containing protein [Streptomyces olivoverticillatus]|uniref:Phenyloxazoline synthase MbtB n=1 Tax=Streptomyces olivoverticillatus TaxID=66427 RepID=A0A7W7LTB4_9ACTN|nr:non-ribosomal peptide synthetase/type I polyketide synthase [Streptomyces olivoverticillatus]MBB4895859.1 amino acid adenylation domain-containing protein [Streptomyces olivoverticillatus]
MTSRSDDTRQSVLAQSLLEIRRLRAELKKAEQATGAPIAIVGMACRMPGGAQNPDEFWEFLRAGRDGISDIPAERFDADAYYDPTPGTPGKMATRRAGLLPAVDRFDAGFFGVAPREAAWLDPQQRLVLEVGWEALEHAGTNAAALRSSATGVFLGITNSDYGQLLMQQMDPPDLEAYGLTSSASTFAAGRLSYWLGLSGPSMSVDTACSSSLVAVHLACQSLRSGDCTTALAGGVNVLLSPEWFVVLSKANMLAPDGRCKTFDAAADGYVRGEGAGMLVLKRLSDAVADGDRIHAVIRGSAVNQDGRSSGITVPNGKAQQDVVRRALRAASVTAAEVDYVEAHGTGTPLGDPIELRALEAVLGERGDRGPLRVGSVKTNVGHLEPASGIAGLIKLVLALEHEEIPPHRNLGMLNPEISLDEPAIEIPTDVTPWPRTGKPRIAGVSSFGASGTNAHVIVAEAPETRPGAAPTRPMHLLTLSAKSPAALTDLAARYQRTLARAAEGAASDTAVADICFTANTGREHFPHRLGIVGATAAELADSLTTAAGEDWAAAGVRRGHASYGSRPKAVFLFTGQGAQYPAMARTLYETEPVYARVIDRCDEVLTPVLGRSLRSVLDGEDGDSALIHRTEYTQPALFAVEYALAQLWKSWGIEPAAVLGHSVGELVAACVAGVLPAEDGLVLAARRGRLMAELTEPGSMATVFAPAEVVGEAVRPFAAEVSIAAVNGPQSVVVSGAGGAVGELLAELAGQGIKSKLLAVSRAFHSPLMEPMLDRFEREAATIAYAAPRIPLISNVTGKPLTGEGAFTAQYLREHVRAPVQFLAGMNELYGQSYRTFVEVGPAPTLLGMAKRFAPDPGAHAEAAAFLPSLRPGRPDSRVLLDSLGELYVRGFAVNWTGLAGGEDRRKVALPTYPFQRSRHWFRPSSRTPASAATAPAGPSTLLGRRIPSPLDSIQFASRLDADVHPCLADCVVDGLTVVNIGVYLDAALAAAREIGRCGPLVLTDCLVPQSLILDPEQRRPVQLVLQPQDDGSAAYRYYAADQADGEDRWVLHAQGRVAPAAALGASATRAPDPRSVAARLADELPGVDFYRQLWQRKSHLGPSVQWIDHVWHTPGEAVARMRAPQPGETDPYQLHPGLTDASFQLLFACLPPDTPADAVFMLVGIDRFAFHGYDGARELFCHARLLPTSDPAGMLIAEVRLLDADGRLTAEIGGVCLKRADRSSLLRTAPVPTAGRPAADEPVVTRGISTAEPDVQALVTSTVAGALRAPEAELDLHEPLPNLGLDSLMALEVKNALSMRLGISLPLAAFLEGRSIAELGAYVRSLVDGADTGSEEATQDGPPDTSGRVLVHDHAARFEPFAMTDLQQAYLVGRSGAFELGNVSTYFFIEVDVDDLDLDRLTAAFQRMVGRHDMLRAVVDPDGTQRVLADVPPYQPHVVDLTGCTEQEREQRLAEIHREMKHQVFDTAVWPLFDIRATRVDGCRTRLHVGLDALIIDAWSTSLLFREWAAAYRDPDRQLPEPAITYRDYVLATRELQQSPDHAASLEYWRERVKTLPPAPELPLATNPSSLAEPEFTHRSARIEEDGWVRFKHHAANAGVTPSAALCTAYAQVLAAWSKSSHFTLNLLVFNRMPLHPDVESVVGNFSATTLLEVRHSPAEAFTARAEKLQKQLWQDLEHSRVSGVQVLRELNRARGNAAAAGMPVVFASTVNFAARDGATSAGGFAQHLLDMGVNGREVSSQIRTPQVWLDHQVVEDSGGLLLNWDFVAELFPVGMIDAMFDAYVDVLTSLCEDESAWQRPAAVLVPSGQLEVRRQVNASAAPMTDALLHEAFAEHAASDPDRTAVIAPGRTLSYGELDGLSNQLARRLRASGAAPGVLVGVVMEKGWEQVAAVLGVTKSGAAYVPIDAAVPAERLRLLLADAGIALVLTQSWVAERSDWPDGITRLSVDGPGALAESDEPLAPPATTATDLAYVIYTSGSTGVPKGVMIEHAGAVNTIRDVNERFGITSRDRVLALSALNFDLSVYDVFGILSAGGALVLPAADAHREPAAWARLVEDHQVTVWNTVPALMEMYTEHVLAGARDVAPPLRVVMMSGDWIPVALPGRIRRLLPDAGIWSLGGATEASIWSIVHKIERVDPAWASIPYGVPMRNQQFHVLNEALQPCPDWVPGHLHIAGAGLARGYFGDQRRTRAAFIRHPATGERLYRTGDLGRYLPDGTIEFLGREDFQVKIGGYRIELGEVEAALTQQPGVRAAVAVAAGAPRGAKRLVGYVVADRDSELTESGLRHVLGQVLPEYLVPQRIVLLDELPLSANGKVDRAALPHPDGQVGAERRTQPRNDIEEQLAAIWAEFFTTESVGVTDDFFDLGGDSMLAVRLMARIKQHFGRSLPLAVLFTHPTIELLATTLGETDGEHRRSALVPIRTGGTEAPLVLVHPVGGDVLCYAELAGLLGADQPVYALQVPDTGTPLATVADLAAHYVEAVTTALPDGPYRLGGWSMGGVIALEVARRLSAAGAQVGLVAVIDLLEPPGPAPGEVTEAGLLSWFAGDLAGLADSGWNLPPEAFGASHGTDALAVLHERARAADVLPHDIDAETLGRVVQRFCTNARALRAHRPQPYEGTVRFFRAKDGGASVETAKRWLGLLPGDAEVVDVPGDHYSVMRTPQLAVLADELGHAMTVPEGSPNPITSSGLEAL